MFGDYNYTFNTLRPRQKGCHSADDIVKCILLNENVWISITISLKFVRKGQINNIPALVQIMAWRRPGDKPLSEPMMVSLLTHICITRPQWVKIASASRRSKRHVGRVGISNLVVRFVMCCHCYYNSLLNFQKENVQNFVCDIYMNYLWWLNSTK